MLKPFASARYTWLWLSNACGSTGRWALVLVLSAQLLQITHSSFWVGCGLFLTQGPVIVLAPFSGVLADRFDRRTMNVLAAAVSAIVTGLFAALTVLGRLSLPVMLALSLAYGISFVFQLTLRSTLVPSLVREDELMSGISLFQVGTQGSQFLGPLVAAPLLVWRGPAAAWSLCAILYVLSAVLSVPVGEVRAQPATSGSNHSIRTSVAYLWSRALAWTAIWAVSLHCALTMAYQGMLPMFVSMDLHGTNGDYGALLASIGLGAVVGSVGLAWFSAREYRAALFIFSLVGSGVSLAIMGASQSVPLAVLVGFLVGGTQAMFMSMALALIQGSVEDEFRGRATGVYQMITLAPMAIFGWGMGGLADVTEPSPLMVVSGLAFVVLMGALALVSPWLRTLFRAGGWTYGQEPAVASTAVS